MKRSGLKTMNDPLTSDPAAAFHNFETAMKKIVALPKSALAEKPKRRTRRKK
jgi:hypothetical protein